jgi:hypothetical protein
MLSGDGQWKTYLPKANFKSGDPTGYKGEKVFEQPLIATHPGPQTIPALSFSYFDPTTRRYETARTSPLNVNINASVAESAPSAAAPDAGTVAKSPSASPNGLRPDHAAAGPFVGSLVPLYFQPRFLAIPSLVALMFAGAWLTQRQRERSAHAARSGERLLRAKVDAALAQMSAAAAAGDAALFFASARIALQQILGRQWQVPADDVSTADVDSRLGSAAADIRQIFMLADEANYSGHRIKATDFNRWTQTVRGQLSQGYAS